MKNENQIVAWKRYSDVSLLKENKLDFDVGPSQIKGQLHGHRTDQCLHFSMNKQLYLSPRNVFKSALEVSVITEHQLNYTSSQWSRTQPNKRVCPPNSLLWSVIIPWLWYNSLTLSSEAGLPQSYFMCRSGARPIRNADFHRRSEWEQSVGGHVKVTDDVMVERASSSEVIKASLFLSIRSAWAN